MTMIISCCHLMFSSLFFIPCYHLMLSFKIITAPAIIIPENLSHSSKYGIVTFTGIILLNDIECPLSVVSNVTWVWKVIVTTSRTQDVVFASSKPFEFEIISAASSWPRKIFVNPLFLLKLLYFLKLNKWNTLQKFLI
jgi:hypothetical protein